jgi:enoyl-CoA hydratase/carnithine racemase
MLPHFLSHSKVIDILFRGEKISASELKNLGLINDFYNESEFVKKTKTEESGIYK